MTALRVVLATATTSIVAMLVYVAGSYLLMRRYTLTRPWRMTLREAFREAWLVVLTQPFLPLFYVLGRSFGGRGGTQPIVFVHGYAQNRVGFWWLARALRKRGLGPFYAVNYSFVRGIPTAAESVRHFVDAVLVETRHSAVDLVCHSMGGLVAMEFLREGASLKRVRRCVTIATPHAGVLWRGPIFGASGVQLRKDSAFLRQLVAGQLPVPVLSIFSTHDNVVYPPATAALAARGGRDESVAGGGHLSLLFNPRVADLIAGFLKQPEAVSVTAALAEPNAGASGSASGPAP